MSLAYMGESFGNMMGQVGEHPEWCFLQAILISYFSLAALLWAFLIAYTLHQAFLNNLQAFNAVNVQQFHKKYLGA